MRRAHLVAGVVCAAIVLWSHVGATAQGRLRPSVYQTTLEEPNQVTPEITTEELVAILAAKSEPVFDVRSAKEYAIGHIPGTVNVSELEVQRISELYPDRGTRMILYCNGPSCGKSKRTSEQLVARGYTRVRRYQLGISVWRALSHTVQTDLPVRPASRDDGPVSADEGLGSYLLSAVTNGSVPGKQLDDAEQTYNAERHQVPRRRQEDEQREGDNDQHRARDPSRQRI